MPPFDYIDYPLYPLFPSPGGASESEEIANDNHTPSVTTRIWLYGRRVAHIVIWEGHVNPVAAGRLRAISEKHSQVSDVEEFVSVASDPIRRLLLLGGSVGPSFDGRYGATLLGRTLIADTPELAAEWLLSTYPPESPST